MKNNLRFLLAERKMNIQDLSKEVDITAQTLYGIYHEKTNPNMKTIKKLVKYFGVTYGEFFKEED